MSTDLDALLRGADPLREHDLAPPTTLPVARARVDRARRPAPARPRWGRRLVLAAAVAAAVAVVVVTVTPGGTDPDSPGAPAHRSGALLPAAVAANGEIVSDPTYSAYAAAIAPKGAVLRLLPAHLPEGWSYRQVRAAVETESSWDVPASLVAVETTPDDVVTGSVSVVGPVEATVRAERTVPDVVDGHPARLFVFDDIPDPDTSRFPTRIWWWTDDAGEQWQVSTVNLSPEDARRAVDAVSTSGDQVVWDASTEPQLRIVHQRRGPAYPTARSDLAWYLDLSDGQRDRDVRITRSDGSDPLPVAAVRADVGNQITTIDGHPAVLWPVGMTESGFVEPPVAGAPRCRLVEYQVDSDVRAMTRACGDEPEVAAMLASLADVPRSDPRLTRYALDE